MIDDPVNYDYGCCRHDNDDDDDDDVDDNDDDDNEDVDEDNDEDEDDDNDDHDDGVDNCDEDIMVTIATTMMLNIIDIHSNIWAIILEYTAYKRTY